MISDAGGEAIDLETTPAEVFWMQPENQMLVHANHFLTDAARAKVQDTGLRETPCSLYRVTRTKAALSQFHGELTLDHMKRAFADKYGAPYSVCAEPVACARGAVYSTVATILMDTTDRKMFVASGPYKGATYQEYDFERPSDF